MSEKGKPQELPQDAPMPQKEGDAPATEIPVAPEQEWKQKAQEHLTALKYMAADFDNFRKQSDKSRQEAMTLGESRMLLALLPTLDELSAAVEALKKTGGETHVQGVLMVEKNLHRILRGFGLKQVDTSKTFDPHCMEAEGFADVADAKKDGHPVAVLAQGYWRNQTLLRPARVVVGKYVDKNAAAPQGNATQEPQGKQETH